MDSAARYYRRWLKAAFTGAWRGADTASTVVGIFGPAVVAVTGSEDINLAKLVGYAGIGALATVGLVRLICAPFWLHVKDATEHEKEMGGEQRRADDAEARAAAVEDVDVRRLREAQRQLRDYAAWLHEAISEGTGWARATGFLDATRDEMAGFLSGRCVRCFDKARVPMTSKEAQEFEQFRNNDEQGRPLREKALRPVAECLEKMAEDLTLDDLKPHVLH